MDPQDLLTRYTPLLKQYALPLVLIFFGLICLGYGLISFRKPVQSVQAPPLASVKEQNTSPQPPVPTATARITIDIEGAVLKPGVYTLAGGSRVQDALVVSGGLSGKADRQTVAKSLNLASKLTDGTKLYIPFSGEQVVLSSATQGEGGEQQGGVMNINLAGADALDTLPGVGAVTAQKIIAGRPYQSVDELVQKKIVGPKVFDQIKDKITVN